MDKRGSLLDLEPEIQEGLKQATGMIDDLLAGPDFQGKKILELQGKGMTLSEIFGISDIHLEAAFFQATQFLQAGRVRKAREILYRLVRLQPMDERFTYGLAATFQFAGEYRTAGRLYGVYLSMNAECVQGRLRLGECLLAEREYGAAMEMFDSVARDEEATRDCPRLRDYARNMLSRCVSLNSSSAMH
jgi:tetratricopeptide (TPR) repeat protein